MIWTLLTCFLFCFVVVAVLECFRIYLLIWFLKGYFFNCKLKFQIEFGFVNLVRVLIWLRMDFFRLFLWKVTTQQFSCIYENFQIIMHITFTLLFVSCLALLASKHLCVKIKTHHFQQKKEVKNLSSPKRKTYFKMFVRLWNKRHLPAVSQQMSSEIVTLKIYCTYNIVAVSFLSLSPPPQFSLHSSL